MVSLGKKDFLGPESFHPAFHEAGSWVIYYTWFQESELVLIKLYPSVAAAGLSWHWESSIAFLDFSLNFEARLLDKVVSKATLFLNRCLCRDDKPDYVYYMNTRKCAKYTTFIWNLGRQIKFY